MSVPTEALHDITAVANDLVAQGYFERAHDGDERAASLFARLVASTANPTGKSFSWGWLKKTGGGFNVDGFADGAIVYGNDPSDVNNVVKIVTQVGSDHAGIGDAVQPRRESDIWFRPQPLSPAELLYLRPHGVPEPPTPRQPAKPLYPSYEALGGDEGGKKITRLLEYDYKRAGMHGLDGDCGAWQQRVSYDFLTGICPTVEASIAKHREEWCQTLGISVD